jgi:hypothetical protein
MCERARACVRVCSSLYTAMIMHVFSNDDARTVNRQVKTHHIRERSIEVGEVALESLIVLLP